MAGRFRLLDWLWPGAQHNPTRDGQSGSPRARELTRRAELAVELGERARTPAERLVHGEGAPLSCDLYAQAVRWALAAHELGRNQVGPTEATPEVALDTLWQRADPELLARAAGGVDALERLRTDVSKRSFIEFAELTNGSQLELASRLARFADELLVPLRSERSARERLWARRLLRVGSLLLAVIIVTVAVKKTLTWREERNDLTRRATFTLSSSYTGVGGCSSPLQECAEGANFFFHTLDDKDPWIVFDLGRPRAISRIVVENRRDCCTERAVPLVVEVSNDREKWKEVARRRVEFTTWREHFPTVRGRFVKLHVPRPAILHLSRVKILP